MSSGLSQSLLLYSNTFSSNHLRTFNLHRPLPERPVPTINLGLVSFGTESPTAFDIDGGSASSSLAIINSTRPHNRRPCVKPLTIPKRTDTSSTKFTSRLQYQFRGPLSPCRRVSLRHESEFNMTTPNLANYAEQVWISSPSSSPSLFLLISVSQQQFYGTRHIVKPRQA